MGKAGANRQQNSEETGNRIGKSSLHQTSKVGGNTEVDIKKRIVGFVSEIFAGGIKKLKSKDSLRSTLKSKTLKPMLLIFIINPHRLRC
jgi:hypothetical protein